jgi:MFS family permease
MKSTDDNVASEKKNWSGQEETWPESPYAWYVTAFLTVSFALAYIDRQVIALLVGPIKADLGLNDVEVSLLGGFAFVLFYTIMGIPLGRLTDRTNRVRLIAVGIFFWSLMTMTCGLARSFTQLFLARVGVGVGEATLSPAALSIIADYFPPKKLGTATSVYLTGSWIGTGLAFILGGAVIDFVGDVDSVSMWILGDVKPWQLVFIVVGAPGTLLSLLTLTVREPHRRQRIATEGHVIPLPEVAKFLWERKNSTSYILLVLVSL